MKGVRVFLVLAVAAVGLAYLVFSSSSRRDAVPSNNDVQTVADLIVGEPIVFGNLAIFPVSARASRDNDRFITLDEGLQAGTVEIFERGAAPAGEAPADEQTDALPASSSPAPNAPAAQTVDPFASPPGQGNSVNQLAVVNHSDKPLYLMPGEIIIGGSQDRTIRQELVIAPDGKPVPLNVYCVEHGRWGGRDTQDYAGLLPRAVRFAAIDLGADADRAAVAAAIAPTRGVRADSWDDVGRPADVDSFHGNLSLEVSQTTEVANAGRFIGSIGSLNKQARVAVQAGEGQGKVWDEVATENAKAGVSAQSGTFAGNYAEDKSAERLTAYVDHMQSPISQTPNIVGVIVAVNGKMETIDVFESTPLFTKLWPKLLKSYALDAANAADDSSPAKQASQADARNFLREVAQAKAAPVQSDGELALARGDSDDVLVFSAHDRRSAQPAAPNAHGDIITASFGFGGAIHSSGFSK